MKSRIRMDSRHISKDLDRNTDHAENLYFLQKGIV